MVDLSRTHAFSAMSAIRYDDAHGNLLIANNGEIWEWNPVSGAILSFSIANAYLGDVDITPDGRYALLDDWNGSGPAGVVRLDLNSNTLTTFSGPNTYVNAEGLATTTSSQGLIVTSGGPSLQIEFINVTGGSWNLSQIVYSAPTTEVKDHYILDFGIGMVSSENHRLVLVQAEQNLSPTSDVFGNIYYPVADKPAALYLYDSSAGRISASNTSAFPDAFDQARFNQASGDDVSEAAKMAAVAHGGVIDIFDLSLHRTATVAVNGAYLLTAHFSASGHQLFAWDSQANDIRVFDALSWTQVGLIHAGSAADGQAGRANFSDFGQMTTSLDGRLLFLQDYVVGQGGVVEAIDLAYHLSLTVNGDASHPSLFGSIGADTLTGGSENDVADGEGGDDLMDGGGGFNTASYASATGSVTVSLALQGSAQNTLNAGNDTLFSFKGLVGSHFADHLSGDANDNVIDGGGGNDTLDGGGGVNTVSFASGVSGVSVSLALQGQPQATGVGTDTLIHFQNLTGSAYGDRLTGDAGANVLTGGGGADTFVFTSGAGQDTVSDFSNADGDHIDLSAFGARLMADALSHAQQVGSDTVFTYGTDSLTLQNVSERALTTHDLGLSAPTAHDVTGSGYSAVVFRDPGGNWGYATFNRSGGYSWVPMGGSTPSYGLVGAGDFNGDGVCDLLFREGPTGAWGFAQMSGQGGYVWQFMGGSTASYGEVAVGDFNGDGIADIIFREQRTGNWGIAQMHGAAYAWQPMGGSTQSYSLAGTGDFNGDGIADVLFRENATGAWGFAQMNASGGYVWNFMGGSTASYSVVGTGDFNGDGISDILFRDNATGDWGYAQMHGTAYAWLPMGGSTASYSVVGTGDYSGDGIADIAFREAATGNWGYAAMHATNWDWHFMGASTASYGAF